MKLAYLCPEYLSFEGGAQYHVRNLARELVKRGHQITIFTEYNAEDEDGKFNNSTGVRIVKLPRTRWREFLYRGLLKVENRRGFFRIGRMLQRSGSLRIMAGGPYCADIRRPELFEKYDVIINFMSGTYCWGLLFASALSGLRHKVTVAVPLFHVREGGADWPIQRRIHQRYSSIVTNTEYESAYLSNLGWRRDRMTAIGVGSDIVNKVIDVDTFRQAHSIPLDVSVVLFLGRKVYNKGITHVIESRCVVSAYRIHS